MKTTIKELKKIEGDTHRWIHFRNEVINKFIENKQEIKGQKLNNNMTITGIGAKSIKIENNFYSWEDIETYATGKYELENPDDILPYIIEYIFEDYNIENKETYTAHKFTTTTKFNEIKKEIIENKKYYIKEIITGIGAKSIKIGYDYDSRYISWETIEKIYDDAKQGLTRIDIEEKYPYESATITVFYMLFEENVTYQGIEKEVYETGDMNLLRCIRLHRQGKLTYMKLQEIAKNPAEIDRILQVIFKMTGKHTIPLTFRKNKVYKEVGQRGDLNPHLRDEEQTAILHRAPELQEYYVAKVPKNEREHYKKGYYNNDTSKITMYRTNYSTHVHFSEDMYHHRHIKADLQRKRYDFAESTEDGIIRYVFYDADNTQETWKPYQIERYFIQFQKQR